ncbi:MAG: hypothetical protein ACE5G8_04750 [Anaerolineae bacterium]
MSATGHQTQNLIAPPLTFKPLLWRIALTTLILFALAGPGARLLQGIV